MEGVSEVSKVACEYFESLFTSQGMLNEDVVFEGIEKYILEDMNARLNR